MTLTWLLAIAAIALWLLAILWVFWRDIRRLWKTRNDKWFRTDY